MIESYVDYANVVDFDIDVNLGVCLYVCVCDKKTATNNRETNIFLLAFHLQSFDI